MALSGGALFVLLALSGCAPPESSRDPLPPEEEETTIDVRRVGQSVEVRRSVGDREVFRLDVAAGERIVLSAHSISPEQASEEPSDMDVTIDAAATGPGVAITAKATASIGEGDPASLDIQNDLVLEGDVAYRLYEPAERDDVVRQIAGGPLGAAFRELAAYRGAVTGHLAEASAVFEVVGLFQEWPDGVEPAWPALDDPRDTDPPGHLEGDVVGLGMTCSSKIRCPSHAPYCVTADHAEARGVCTRACAADDDCAAPSGIGRCSLPVTDIPDVPGSVLACRIECDEGACPGLLLCDEGATACEASQ